eukprot:750247-Rhodomonas_salina.2
MMVIMIIVTLTSTTIVSIINTSTPIITIDVSAFEALKQELRFARLLEGFGLCDGFGNEVCLEVDRTQRLHN